MKIHDAIVRSIRQNEIVHCEYEGDESALLLEVDDDEAIVSYENNGEIDIAAEEWRIKVTLVPSYQELAVVSDKELVRYALSTLKANLDEITLDDLHESEEVLEQRLEELIDRVLLMSDEHIRELIKAIDRFHGNELKNRTASHIQQEVSVIKKHLVGAE
tara:strand:- start:366 stop:845 length:480 start_codon:yes stop_codon:yes gene_type:complete